MAAGRIAALALGVMLGMQAATQFVAWNLDYAPGLGPAWHVSPDFSLYPPWAVMEWRAKLGATAPKAFSSAGLMLVLGVATGSFIGMVLEPDRGSGRRRGWGGLADARAAGLLDKCGCVIGELKGKLLITADLRPTLVTGGTRSGKGRGHVVPTLLSWPESVLVHDPKGELWRTSAGWRSRFSHTLYFDPRDLTSARWNPLAEIQPGPAEVAQVQRLVAILADPGGARDDEQIWDRAASEILEALILHVLYAAPDEEKTLLTARRLLADLDASAEVMLKTLHRVGASGEPETHPFIKTAAMGYAAMHDRFRTSVQGTARSYLKWLAGEDVERALSVSDFRIGDLMCAASPMSLYVRLAPADAVALRPLVRLLFYAAVQNLTAHEAEDAAGRRKLRKLLMVLDEFPLLGRLQFLEKGLRLMSGYGVKAMLVAQSLNDLAETYGAHNSLLDNCAVYTAFSALDPLTQDKVSKLTGLVTELRASRSGPAGLAAGRSSLSRSETDRPLMEPGDVRALADDEQLVFVAGHRPLRTRKVRYDRRAPFKARAAEQPPAHAGGFDTPGAPSHPWAGRRALGEIDGDDLPLFRDRSSALDQKKVTARAAEVYERMAGELAAQEAFFDHLQERRHV